MSQQQTITLSGMTCGSCVAKVSQRLEAHADVQEAQVTLEPPQAVIKVSRKLTSDETNAWLAEAGSYRVADDKPAAAPDPGPEKNATTYKPLIILLAYLLAVTFIVSGFAMEAAMRYFMAGFFIAFSFFKMLDLRGFADAYRGYDFVAKAWPAYALIYPFIELGLGLAYLANVSPVLVNSITAVVMVVSLAGVLHAVLSRKTIRCACLGTVFNLPMSTVTIIEDGLMLLMAVVMLIMAL